MKKWIPLAMLLACNLYPHENSRDIFTRIYEYGGWGRNEQGKGFSGYGSTLENTRSYIQFLDDFLLANNIQSVVDLGCGDWSFSQYIDWGSASYQGLDVVEQVIKEDIQKYASPTVAFLHADLLAVEFPAADLLLCKDVLMHLTNSDIQQILNKIGQFKHCLFTNDVDPETLTANNHDISRGEFRWLDLTAPPFNLKAVKIYHYRTDHSVKQIIYATNKTESM